MDNPVSETQGEINQPLQQQQPIQQPPQNKTSLFSKWILLSIAGIALLIIIFGGVYLLSTKNSQQSLQQKEVVKSTPTSTTDSTANWKTLEGPHSTIQNSPYSFRYPETWISEIDVINDPPKFYLFFETGKILITKDLQLSDSNPQTIKKGAYITTFSQSNILKSSKSFDDNLAQFDLNNGGLVKSSTFKEERFLLDGQPARKRIEKSDTEGYVQVVFEYPQNAGYMWLDLVSSLGEFEENQKIFNQMLSTFKFTSQNQTIGSNINVKVANGDIVVVNQGKETKITSWGYNSNPILSPDRTKITYLSKSKESIQNEKTDQGYKRISTNVWIINIDGSNPIQLTNHIDFINRNNLHWLDNDRLMFTEGESSVKIYSFSNKTIQTVLGPNKPTTCLDACGYEIGFFYNPDFTYLVRLVGGKAAPYKTAILNTQSLTTLEIDNQFELDFNSVSFTPSNRSITFKGSSSANYTTQQVTIDLLNGKVSY